MPFSDELYVLLQKPAHFSANGKMCSGFSMRAMKHSGVCNVSI